MGLPLIGGTLLALTGMALVLFDGAQLHLSAKGDLLAIGAALCWAVYSLFMSQMTRDYGTITSTRKVFFYGLLTILPFLDGYKDSFSMDILGQTAVWGNLLFLGLVASLVCFILWNLVMDKLGNVTSTNYVYLSHHEYRCALQLLHLGVTLLEASTWPPAYKLQAHAVNAARA